MEWHAQDEIKDREQEKGSEVSLERIEAAIDHKTTVARLRSV